LVLRTTHAATQHEVPPKTNFCQTESATFGTATDAARGFGERAASPFAGRILRTIQFEETADADSQMELDVTTLAP